MKTVSIFNLIVGILLLTFGILDMCNNHWNTAIIDFILGSTNIIIHLLFRILIRFEFSSSTLTNKYLQPRIYWISK